MVETRADAIVGNRWMLVGGVVYLLEWVAIVGGAVAGVSNSAVRGLPVSDMLDSYAGHADVVAFMAGWFAVCLLGRILIFIGLRQSLEDSGYRHPLMDLAVVASAVSVTVEIAAYGLSMIAAAFAHSGDRASAQALDQAGAGVNLMLAGGLGVALLCSVYCTWRAGVFPVVLNVVGLVGGLAAVGAQLTLPPSWQALNDVLYVAPLFLWIWMLWGGVLLWRRTPERVALPA